MPRYALFLTAIVTLLGVQSASADEKLDSLQLSPSLAIS